MFNIQIMKVEFLEMPFNYVMHRKGCKAYMERR